MYDSHDFYSTYLNFTVYRPPALTSPPWEGRQMASKNLRLVDFSAFLEQQGEIERVCTFSCITCKPFQKT